MKQNEISPPLSLDLALNLPRPMLPPKPIWGAAIYSSLHGTPQLHL